MQNLELQWTAVKAAPFLYIGAIIVVGLIIWGGVHLLYRERIEILKERVGGLKDELTKARAEPLPQLPGKEAEPKAGAAKIPHRVILAEVRTTASRASAALASRDEKTMRDALPELAATFLTLSKAYGFPTPTFGGNSHIQPCLKAGARYLNDITPFLRQGHIDEARQTAEKLVPMLNAFLAGKGNI